MKKFTGKGKEGFTLIELMVVMGVIILLLSMVFLAFGRVRRRGTMVRAENLMGQMAAVMEDCAALHDGDYSTCSGDADVTKIKSDIESLPNIGKGNVAVNTAKDKWCVSVKYSRGTTTIEKVCRDLDGVQRRKTCGTGGACQEESQ